MTEFNINLNWIKEQDPYTRKCAVKDETIPELTCVTPPPFNKGIPGYWSPEHLFVASAVVCFFTTTMQIAESSHLNIVDFNVKGTGKIEKNQEDKNIFTTIDLFAELTVLKQSEVKKAVRVLEKSEDYCLVANSMKTKVILHPEVKVKE
ncbi:MAG: OsmC family protein [Promethearchaeota archaeon]